MKFLFSILLINTVALASSLDSMSERLIKLRAEVDQLSAAIQLERTQNSKEVTSLAVQKGNLQSSIDKEKLRISEIQTTLKKYQDQLEVSAQDYSELTPVLNDSLAQLEAYIDRSLPFQKEHRMQELGRLKGQMESKSISTSQALAKLWSLYEDEFSLARDSGMHRQVIELGGTRELVDVIHLGMFSLFYRSARGEVGLAEKGPEGWKFSARSEASQRKDIVRLFDSFEKKVRVGHFNLPTSTGGTL